MKKIICLFTAVVMLFTVSACKKDNTAAQSQSLSPEKTFTFYAFDIDGNELCCEEIKTEETVVGTALKAAGLIDGEDGPYGLYVKTVCGVNADYETDGTYWCFYINDEMSNSGVDKTEIEDGQNYSFKVCN